MSGSNVRMSWSDASMTVTSAPKRRKASAISSPM